MSSKLLLSGFGHPFWPSFHLYLDKLLICDTDFIYFELIDITYMIVYIVIVDAIDYMIVDYMSVDDWIE